MKIYLSSLLLFISLAWLVSCQPSQRILEDSKRNTPPAPEEKDSANQTPQDDFDSRLKSVQSGNFEFVYSFRRKDGEVFISEDKRYLKENSPRDTNQWVLTTDEKAVIAGSNYPFTPENLDALKKRFEITNHSIIMDEKNK